MLSKSQQSLIKSLQLKKFRKAHGLFIAEGLKCITEFQKANYTLEKVFYVPDKSSKMNNFSENEKHQPVSSEELKKISALKQPQQALALFKTPFLGEPKLADLKGNFTLVLDEVQDPGNLGTILRTADWFGLRHVICSTHTADVYNPKVIQASMGSLAHIQVSYQDLPTWLPKIPLPKFGMLLQGESIASAHFGKEALLILGNEGQGIRAEVQALLNQEITIPRFGNAESLNVAIAAAILCAQVRL